MVPIALLTPKHNNMYTSQEKKILLQQSKLAIHYGLQHQKKMVIDKVKFSSCLLENRASFVTLQLNNNLRGCIGTLTANRPLVEDVTYNAYSAAFEDPRFPTLTPDEFQSTSIDISVLSIPEKLYFSDELELLSQLRIGIDGIIFEYQHYRATYLPTVWHSFSTAQLFMNSLKQKAGLAANFWSNSVCCYRYTTEIIS